MPRYIAELVSGVENGGIQLWISRKHYRGAGAINVMREGFKSVPRLTPFAKTSLLTLILIFPIDSQIPDWCWDLLDYLFHFYLQKADFRDKKLSDSGYCRGSRLPLDWVIFCKSWPHQHSPSRDSDWPGWCQFWSYATPLWNLFHYLRQGAKPRD